MMMKSDLYNLVFSYIKTIPKGKVATYGLVAEALRAKRRGINGHLVGWILHKNDSSMVPCHRVVDRNGRLAPNFAFDGAKEQRRRLQVEGVTFVDDMHVDLERHLIKK
ncbi:MGMT family protein [Candidatus Gottesmanbacteria bacterium]|nr:MGMT family protein [Candidatus Gottesmanbacteria bacterium]